MAAGAVAFHDAPGRNTAVAFLTAVPPGLLRPAGGSYAPAAVAATAFAASRTAPATAPATLSLKTLGTM